MPQVAEAAENPRSSPRYLRERPDASDDDTAVLPRNTHFSPPSGEGPWPTVKPVPPSYQPEEDSTSTLGTGSFEGRRLYHHCLPPETTPQSIRDLRQGQCGRATAKLRRGAALAHGDADARHAGNAGKLIPVVRLCREGLADGVSAGVRCTTAVAGDPQRLASEGSPGWGMGPRRGRSQR